MRPLTLHPAAPMRDADIRPEKPRIPSGVVIVSAIGLLDIGSAVVTLLGSGLGWLP